MPFENVPKEELKKCHINVISDLSFESNFQDRTTTNALVISINFTSTRYLLLGENTEGPLFAIGTTSCSACPANNLPARKWRA